jgi:hypothetical protein
VSHPFWLRGAISQWANQYLPVNTRPITAKGLQVGTQYVTEYDYLLALALEKSGFKGMRLIIDSTVLPDHGRVHQRRWSGFQRPLGIIARLRECNYPAGSDYADVLWMADEETRFGHLRGIMAKRFKESTHDPDELMQAAWTRAVFDQTDTLVWACRQAFAPAEERPVEAPESPGITPIVPATQSPLAEGVTTAGEATPIDLRESPDSGMPNPPINPTSSAGG